MGQVKMACPKCQEKFQAKKADIYECPKCGTNIRAKKSKKEDLEATQKFQV
ncbi:MAG: hypothetical protein R8K54_05085 [Mariprofundaceae bacterium]